MSIVRIPLVLPGSAMDRIPAYVAGQLISPKKHSKDFGSFC